MDSLRHVRIAMVAYANYFNDARIKNYIDTLLDAGVNVDVLALGKVMGACQEGRLFLRCLGFKYRGANTFAYLYAQVRFLAKAFWHLFVHSLDKPYHIIHVHNMPNILALIGVPFKLAGTKIILDIHDTMPEAIATTLDIPLESSLIKFLVAEELVSAAVSDKIIATNDMHRDVLVGHGIPPRKIVQILNVGNRKIFKPRIYRHPVQEFWLGYHGTIAKRLGLLLIVEALSSIRKECPDLRFLCVGDGYDLSSMKSIAAKKDITTIIEWRPFVDVEKLPEVLRNVHVGIIGNLWETEKKNNYMLPVKALEYAAMEIPTIMPRLKVLKRYFDETSAFFYEPDDPCDMAQVIRSIYQDRRLIETRIDGLKKFNQNYNWDIMAKRYLDMIDELVD